MPLLRARAAAAWLAVAVMLAACSMEADPAAPPSARPPVAGSSMPSPSDGMPAGSVAPSRSGAPSATPAPASSIPTPSPDVDSTAYTVRAGDTLYSIARRFATTVQQLQHWNAPRYPSLADDATSIEVGWTLVVADQAGVTPVPAGTAHPAPGPSTGCRAGERVAAGGVQTFSTVPNAGAEVALTFDMGGRMDPAVDIMRFLVANEVCATIFATGVMSQTPEGAEVLAIVREHPELFEIANHTMYHCDLVRGGGGSPRTAPCQTGGAPSVEFIREELADADVLLRDATGQEPQPYWRPPYGSVNQRVIDAAAAMGYTKTFMWDIDTIDWKPMSDGGPSAEQIAAKVTTRAVSGSNVLLHLGGYETLDALRLIVPALRDRGFTVTSLSDLLDGR